MNTLKQVEKSGFEVKSAVEHKKLIKSSYSVHYFVSGNENDETVIFLHPAFGDHRCFDKQIDYFSPKFKVITLDMLGHGLTGVSQSNDKISSVSTHISEILQAENSQKAHIVGVSLGSLLAQGFALKYPEKTLSLTVLGGYNINKKQKDIAKAQQNKMFKWLFKMIFSMDAFRRYVASTTSINETAQACFYESAKLFTRKSFKMMSGLDKLIANRDVERTYPLLILAGDKDAEQVIQSNKEWHKSDTASEMKIIKNAGHCANMDNDKEFNVILMNFLSKK